MQASDVIIQFIIVVLTHITKIYLWCIFKYILENPIYLSIYLSLIKVLKYILVTYIFSYIFICFQIYF